MKTITIKMQDQEAQELKHFVKEHHYPSKSEFIRNVVLEKMETTLTEQTLKDINKSIREIKQGKTISLEEIEKEYGL